MKIQVTVFASLKDLFKPEFQVDIKDSASVSDLAEVIAKTSDDAASLLKKCRFAVEKKFVGANYKLNNYDHVFIIPPSSGG